MLQKDDQHRLINYTSTKSKNLFSKNVDWQSETLLTLLEYRKDQWKTFYLLQQVRIFLLIFAQVYCIHDGLLYRRWNQISNIQYFFGVCWIMNKFRILFVHSIMSHWVVFLFSLFVCPSHLDWMCACIFYKRRVVHRISNCVCMGIVSEIESAAQNWNGSKRFIPSTLNGRHTHTQKTHTEQTFLKRLTCEMYACIHVPARRCGTECPKWKRLCGIIANSNNPGK